jgi:hypothetical protein
VTLAYLKGKDAESSAGACEQQQPSTLRIKRRNIVTGVFWLARPESPVLVLEGQFPVCQVSGGSEFTPPAAPLAIYAGCKRIAHLKPRA